MHACRSHLQYDQALAAARGRLQVILLYSFLPLNMDVALAGIPLPDMLDGS